MSEYKNWQIGASTACFRLFDEKMCDEYVEAGITCMELSSTYDAYYRELDFPHNALKLGRTARDAGVWIRSLHLPFGTTLDVTSLNDADRENTMKVNSELIEAASEAGCSVIVIHPSAEPITDDIRPRKLQYSHDNLGILSRKCRGLGMKLAVEDLPRSCLGHNSAEIKQLLDGNPDLYVTFDTNHLLIQDNVEFIRDIGSRIITLHVSDYDFIDERHVMPLEGKNDWKGIIAALEEVGYRGPWLYELKRGYSARQIVENKHKLGEL